MNRTNKLSCLYCLGRLLSISEGRCGKIKIVVPLRVTAVTTSHYNSRAELPHAQQEQHPQHGRDGGELAVSTSTLGKT